MSDMEYQNQSFYTESIVTVNEMDETCVQIKETGSPTPCENVVRPRSWISQHCVCIVSCGALILLAGVVAVVTLSNKHELGDQGGQQAAEHPLAKHQFMVAKRDTSPILYVVDHEASGCHEPHCHRCSDSVPDPLPTDENNNGMPCPSSYTCSESIEYNDLIQNIGNHIQTENCMVYVHCCMIKSSVPEGYCENGGTPECVSRDELPRCKCQPGWTGDNCATPSETQVHCSCYNKESIGDRGLSGQRSWPECSSSNKLDQWSVCHMNKDNFNCICNKTDTENNEDDTTPSAALASCDNVNNSHTRRHRSTYSTGQTLDTGADVTASPHTSAASHISTGYFTTMAVVVLTTHS